MLEPLKNSIILIFRMCHYDVAFHNWKHVPRSEVFLSHICTIMMLSTIITASQMSLMAWTVDSFLGMTLVLALISLSLGLIKSIMILLIALSIRYSHVTKSAPTLSSLFRNSFICVPRDMLGGFLLLCLTQIGLMATVFVLCPLYVMYTVSLTILDCSSNSNKREVITIVLCTASSLICFVLITVLV